jgi:DeoR/GlpR family transcriptional regulator of sugar metabolism
MGLTKRQGQMLEILRERKRSSVAELARQVDAPDELVLRDLARLDDLGMVHRYRDGAKILRPSVLAARTEQGTSVKNRIARKALECVQEGETLFLDSGLTMKLFAEGLKQIKNVTVITNSPPVLACLGTEADKRIILIGGEYSGADQCCLGMVTERELADIHVSKVIMGADSIDVESSAVFARVRHFGYIQAAIRNAKQTILLAESSKFNQIRGLKIAELAQVSIIVTDDSLPSGERDALGRRGVSLLIAD